MENASKALLIAAAILIVIILVAFGVKVLNSTSGSKDSASTIGEHLSMAAFNTRIKHYVGPKKSTKEVVELLKIIKSYNEKSTRKIAIHRIVSDTIANNMIKDERQTTSTNIDMYINGLIHPSMEHIPYNLYIYYGDDGYIEVIGLEHGVNFKYKADYNNKIVGYK